MIYISSHKQAGRVEQAFLAGAAEVGSHIVAGFPPPVAFQAAIALLARASGGGVLAETAALVINRAQEDPEFSRGVLDTGVRALEEAFETPERARFFVDQVSTNRHQIRLRSVGNISDSFHDARNRGALLAALALRAIDKAQVEGRPGVPAACSDYVNFMASVREQLHEAANRGDLTRVEAQEFVGALESHVCDGVLDEHDRDVLMNLQLDAMSLHASATRQKILAAYQPAAVHTRGLGNDSTPSLH